MLYSFIRISIGIILLVLVLRFCAKRRKCVSKGARAVIVIAFGILISLTALIPVENLFLTFSSPKEAFIYSWGFDEIINTIEGRDSCMIIYTERKGSFGTRIIPKTQDGYKIGTYLSQKTIFSEFVENSTLDVFQANGTDDYYVFLCGLTSNVDFRVSDSDDSNFSVNFYSLEELGYSEVICYAFVEGIDDGYSIQINDTKIQISP